MTQITTNDARLTRALRDSWCAETSAYETWSPDRPSAGQCAVTALVIQDHLGGDLLRGVVSGESHYWNRLPDSREVDLTSEQFEEFVLDAPPELRDRDYVLSFAPTAERYRILAQRVRNHLLAQRRRPAFADAPDSPEVHDAL